MGSALLVACDAPAPISYVPLPGQPVISVLARPVSISRLVRKRAVPADTSAAAVASALADVRRRTYFLDSTAAAPAARQAINQAQHLTARLAAATYSLAPAIPAPALRPMGKCLPKKQPAPKPAWQLRLTLRGIGRRGQLAFRPWRAAWRQATDSTICYTHGAAFSVDYLNSPAGVRQNFRLAQRPGGPAGPVQVQLALSTSLRVRAEGDAALSFGTAAGPVLRYAGLRAWDATGRTLPSRLALQAGGRELALVVEDDQATYPITIDPLASTPTTAIADPEATTNDQFGVSVAGAGDVNGDGYGDVLIGAIPAASNAQGKAYLYLGSSTGLSATPAVTLTDPNNTSNDYFASVAGAGDVNGDGYADVLVGAPGIATYQGKAYFYLGSSTGLSNTPTTTLNNPGAASGDLFGLDISGTGDVNGDGYADIIIGALGASNNAGKSYFYLGSSMGLSATPTTILSDPAATGGDSFGVSLAGAGDVNGDGYADVLIGASGASNKAGKSYFYRGTSTGLSPTPTTTLSDPGAANNDRFGTSVAGAGDVNGDGYADLLIGAPGTSSDAGKSYVYLGGSGSLNTTPTITFSDPAAANNDQFGTSVAGAGDTNGDGYADLLIGAPGTTNRAGKAYVYLGRSGGPSTAPTTTLSDPAATSGDDFGLVVASAGDVNGDGYADALVASYGYANKQGIVYAYLGSPGTLLATASTTFTGASGSNLGSSVTGVGDVNGDGYGDVLIGASKAATGGKAYFYLGSATGLSTTATTTLNDPASANNDYFGFSAAGAGDVNGDGYADVLVGAYGTSTSAGKTYLYLGSSSGLSTTPTTLSELGAVANNYFGYSVAGAGDVNGDGYADVLIGAPTAAGAGKGYFYLGSSTGLSATPTATLSAASGQFGYSVAGVGDLNGDGYADVLIGAPAAAGGGKGCLYLGSNTGLSASPTLLSDPAATSGDLFGACVAGAGDVDGDGDTDLLIGAPGSTAGAGKCYLYQGSSTGLNITPTAFANPGATSTFGRAATCAGDVNGDGYSDVLIGVSSAGSPNTQGPSYLYLGSSTGLGTTAALSLTDPAATATDLYGNSLAGAGDVNGDGYGDVLIGASGTSSSAGKSYLYLGNVGGARAGRLRLYNTNLATPLSQANRSNGQFGIGLVARSAMGRVRARLVWEAVANSQSFSHQSPITNSTAYSGRGAWTNVPVAGVELKSLVSKAGGATRIRARLEYATSSPLASTTPSNGTGGAGSQPRYSSWTYLAAQQQGQSSGSATPLPVVLIAFVATAQGGDGLLAWQTATEVNNNYFEVQGSSDGQAWQVLGQRPASGAHRYTWLDQTIARYGAPLVYYRLCQVDLDGSAQFSPVVTLRVPASPLAWQVSAYPNPWATGLTVQLITPEAGPATLTLLDITGAVVLQREWLAPAGSQPLPLDEAAALPTGVYLLQVRQQGHSSTVRVVHR